jgi:glyceraldehyde-3-phosphate dehydrogenase (NADP+)
MVYLFCFVLLSINSIISAEYVCPMKDPVTVGPTDSYYSRKPFVDGMKKFFGGVIDDWKGKETIVTSPIIDSSTGERSVIGKLASMGSTESLEVIEVAKKAWNNGQGDWPQMTASQRIHALESVLNDLKSRRDEIAEVLKWEICKSTSDSYAEFGA